MPPLKEYWYFYVGIVGFTAVTMLTLSAGRPRIHEVCTEKTADGDFVLQRVELRDVGDGRTRTMVDNHNRILAMLCGR
jgi:hypothetical protein